MTRPFEILDHTADIGVRAHGATLAEAYANAARGMVSLIVAPETVRPETEMRVEVEGADAVDLLVTWLHRILFLFDAEGFIVCDVAVEAMGEWRLTARLRGETFDLERHVGEMEIKAVTWHGARVEQVDGAWVAEVLLDI